MSTNIKVLCLMFALIGVACVSLAQAPRKSGDSPAETHTTSVWMKKKLEYSQNIFGGIAAGDFDKIVQNAEKLRALNKVEVFVRGRTAAYGTQLNMFQDANEEIIRQANKDNLEGATLAFTQLTLSCVNCHKHLRKPEDK